MCMVTATAVRKKTDYRVYSAYSNYCTKNIAALEKVAFLRAIMSNF